MFTPQAHQTQNKPAQIFANRWQWLVAGLVGCGLGAAVPVLATLDAELWGMAILLLLFAAVALMLGELKRLLLAVIVVEIPIQVDISYFYNHEAVSFSAVGGLNISVTTLCLVILYALWLAELLAKPQAAGHRHRATHVGYAPFIYVTTVIISMLVAIDVMLALFEVNLLLQALLIFIYIAFRVRTPEEVYLVMTMVMFGLLLQYLIVSLLVVTRESFAIGSITARIDYGTRVAGTVGSPNSAASYYTLLLTSMLGFSLAPVGMLIRRASLLTFGLGMLALLLTLSRGGLAGFVLSLVFFCLVAWRMQWISIQLPLLLGLFMIVPLVLYGDLLMARIFVDDGGAAYGRLPLIRLAFRMIRDFPLFGVGANNFAAALDPYLTPDISFEWINTVHNKYLLVWTETGIFGLLAFVSFLFSTVRRGWQIVRLNNRFYSPLALGLIGGICGQMVHMNVDLFTGRPQVQMLWLVAGLIVAMSRMPAQSGQYVQ